MQNKYPQGAITASVIVYQIFCKKPTEDELKNFCCSNNMDLSFLAINYLLCVDKKRLLLK